MKGRLPFISCRNEEDYLYKEELEGFLKSHTLTDLRVAMSRGGAHSLEQIENDCLLICWFMFSISSI